MAGLAPPTAATATAAPYPLPIPPKKTEDEKVDYLNLPCPIPYEEIHREAFSNSLFSATPLALCSLFVHCYCYCIEDIRDRFVFIFIVFEKDYLS